MSAKWWLRPMASPSEARTQAARQRQGQLTKPPGSLGELETIAVRLCGLQDRDRPGIDRLLIVVFAADHGVAEEGVSAFPQSVTVEMVRNFSRGGAAISVLARALNATLEVVNVGTADDLGPLPGVINRRIAPGTANIRHAPAMTPPQLENALQIGIEAAERASVNRMDLFIGGEMGIANTTSAGAVACALLGMAGAALAGPGTGLDDAGVRHKARVIDEAIARHGCARADVLGVLRCLGGFEIAALTGAYLHCAQMGIPVLVDGYISTVAALCAQRLNADVSAWFFYGHHSAEPGHRFVMEALGARPLLHLGMCLGEGSGASVAVPLLRMACLLHNQMATFAEAGVSRALE
ncbi:MAG: nicotinate-nucleotide--dimethylbenzimidazole phosphoribosyltransferase [Sulfuricaulis sp.]|uniref:nicotinate-nucleotide--dimethylbenzimidazole phosphoribosyltransferase n=1 Tax=Sulfuricaulis sp. TaxID=2003553 RepID=UPI0025D9EDB0|nr:nicotinate-nucleotide--dimethylbenzimidazole phosphoribosyltransferase [Sulfuricaulis sp.]MCR4346814.1 nicotinate-nucleotide--dimethylbenzimidazole phosphoribosyltransferase [Sulfuricaulis sp.]